MITRSIAVALLSMLVGAVLNACGDTSTGNLPVSTRHQVLSGASTTAASDGDASIGVGDKDNDQVGDADRDNNRDNDNDASTDYKVDENKFYYDRDDASLRQFGHPAGALEARSIAAAVKRYYRLAATGDGAQACSLVQRSVALAAPRVYGGLAGPSFLRGLKTCDAIVTKLFQQRRSQLPVDPRLLSLTVVRSNGQSAVVLLRFGAIQEPRSLSLVREHNSWRMQTLIDGALS